MTSALGIPYNRAKMTIHDRLKLYMLARTQTYTGEFVFATTPEPNAMDSFSSYKVGIEGDVDSICLEIGMCTVPDFRLASSSLQRASASADAVARAELRSSTTMTPKDNNEHEIPAFSPGRGGLDSKTLKKEVDETTLSVGALHDTHIDGKAASGFKKPGGKAMLFMEIEKKETRREGTAKDMEILLAHFQSLTEESGDEEKISTRSSKENENVDSNKVNFLETSSEPTNIEDYIANQILTNNDNMYHNADITRMLDNRPTSKESELLVPPKKYEPKEQRRYFEDLLAMSTAHYKSEVEKLNYENVRISASIGHAHRVTEQAREEMIRIGKPVLPGTHVLGQGIDIITGRTRRPLFRVNTNGVVWDPREAGSLIDKFVVGAGISFREYHSTNVEEHKLMRNLDDIVDSLAEFNGFSKNGEPALGALTGASEISKFGPLFAKDGVLVKRKIFTPLYQAKMITGFSGGYAVIGSGMGASADVWQMAGPASQQGKASLYGEHQEILALTLNSPVDFTTEPLPSAPLRRKYSKQDELMRFIIPIGGESLRTDFCGNGVLNTLNGYLVSKKKGKKEGEGDEEDEKDEKSEKTSSSTTNSNLDDSENFKNKKMKKNGDAYIPLNDCLMTGYHIVGDLDVGEVNMEGIFQPRDPMEFQESMNEGEIIQLCSSSHINNAIKWLKKYGTHYVDAATVGCEVTQMFRVNKNVLYTNPYMHPRDYIQTILSRSEEEQEGGIDSESSATKLRKEGGGDSEGGEEQEDWIDENSVVSMPSELHRAKTPLSKKIKRRRRLMSNDDNNMKRKISSSIRKMKNVTNGLGEHELVEISMWSDDIISTWLEAKGGDSSLLPENVRDLKSTDLTPFFSSCFKKPAVIARSLESIGHLIGEDGDMLDSCVLDKR